MSEPALSEPRAVPALGLSLGGGGDDLGTDRDFFKKVVLGNNCKNSRVHCKAGSVVAGLYDDLIKQVSVEGDDDTRGD